MLLGLDNGLGCARGQGRRTQHFHLTGKELPMNASLTVTALATVWTCGCAKSQGPTSTAAAPNGSNSNSNKISRSAESAEAPEAPEAGEIKVSLDAVPPAARKTIERELAGAELEDIAKKQRDGQT